MRLNVRDTHSIIDPFPLIRVIFDIVVFEQFKHPPFPRLIIHEFCIPLLSDNPYIFILVNVTVPFPLTTINEHPLPSIDSIEILNFSNPTLPVVSVNTVNVLVTLNRVEPCE